MDGAIGEEEGDWHCYEWEDEGVSEAAALPELTRLVELPTPAAFSELVE